MKKHILASMIVFLMAASPVSAEKKPRITIHYDEQRARVDNRHADSIDIRVDGSYVSLVSRHSQPVVIQLNGHSDDGRLVLKNTGRVQLELVNLKLTSQEGAALWFKNKKRVEMVVPKGTHSSLTVVQCTDTAQYKAAALFAKESLRISGEGRLDVLAQGKGCKGITAKGNITISDLTLHVTTQGDNWAGSRGKFGGGGFPPPHPGDGFPPFGGPDGFHPDSIPDFGGFPPPPPGGDFPPPPFDGEFPGPGGEHGMFPPMGSRGGHGNPKAISAAGNLTIESGKLTIRTACCGGEGLESKQVLTINDGEIDIETMDDAINSGQQIVVNGGSIVARSRGNDAVDCNGSSHAIVIHGGTLYAWSSMGNPEEGLDSDFTPLELCGGRVFSIGGGMMRDEPSKPTNETSQQPSVLLIGMEVDEGTLIEVYEGTPQQPGERIDSFRVPFSMPRSSSIITYPEFQIGGHYFIRSAGKSYALELKEAFTIVSSASPTRPFTALPHRPAVGRQLGRQGPRCRPARRDGGRLGEALSQEVADTVHPVTS